MSAGYQREPLARCHETYFTGDVCGCICRSVWRRVRRSWCSCRRLAVVSVVVAVAVRRLQRRRVSARGMTNGTQELESRIRPVVELGQTGLDFRLVYDALLSGRRMFSPRGGVRRRSSDQLYSVLQVAQERIQIRVADCCSVL